MSQIRCRRVAAALVAPLLAAMAVVATAAPAQAASPLPCVPGGPSAADGNLASQLNQQLGGTLDGYMTAYRVSCARAVVDQVKQRGLPVRAAAIAVTTTIVETTVQNLDGGDRDSVGLYQQRESWGSFAQRTDPVWATNAFLDKMLREVPDWETEPIGEVCQTVQVSAFPDRYQEQAGDGTIIANALWNGHGAGGSISDVSGDGHADILATKPDSTLHYYSNNINTNPDNRPYTSGRQIGDSGWNAFSRVMTGDVSGDGHADLIATKPDGTLWYYPNNINTNPDNRPYTSGREIGTGWNSFNRIMIGDVSGDGHADLVATKPDGTLHYYSNNINTNPDNRPYTSGRQIGDSGWNAFSRVMTGDVSGDGHADLIATKPDGTLWYYPNNINTNPDNRPYTSGREIGTGWNSFNRIF
ncbi:FG-GAP-like repeat-containing protein [Micromonospora sp. NPDC050187]|uniref:FG-GAP-like repeat-containing protein n=1 Tax=Micromonospora sp. NPDC050187 TaxID=3364277 RepID=UPI0037AC8C1D